MSKDAKDTTIIQTQKQIGNKISKFNSNSQKSTIKNKIRNRTKGRKTNNIQAPQQANPVH
jgi:hypothetical protein